MKFTHYVNLWCIAICSSPLLLHAADQEADRAAIMKAVESYTAAFNAADAKMLAAHWRADAVYVNPLSGEQVEGREAITKQFSSLLNVSQGTKLKVDVDSIQFISPHVAVEKGISTVMAPDSDPQLSRYTAIHIKQQGNWLLDRVTEEEVAETASHYEQLQPLEWMIGDWIDQSENMQVETSCKWTRNNNFILRSFKIVSEDQITMSGIQLIGWDPANQKIRSWAFDSEGAFAEATWTSKGDRWMIESNATLTNGLRGSSVNIMTIVDENNFSWKSTGRQMGGNILPNVGEVMITRAKSTE